MVNRKAENELWGGAYARLVHIALAWTRNGADAQELAQEALIRVFDASPEPPRDVKDLVRRAAVVMKGRFLNRRRAEKLRQDPRWIAAAVEESRGLRRTPEDLVATRERGAKLLDGLEKRLRNDPVGREIVQATVEGYDTAADQAEYLGRDIKEIRNTRKRVSRAAEAIAGADGAQIALGWEDGGVTSRSDGEREDSESGEGAEE